MSPTLAVPRVEAASPLGFLGDGAWARAAEAVLLRSQDGRPTRGTTGLRVAASPGRLHVLFHWQGATVRSTHARRDAPLWEEDVVEVFLAPGPSDPARYAELELSPAGTLFDALVENPDGRRDTMRVDAAWDLAELGARVRRPAPGAWRAELSIPLAPLAVIGPVGSAWRANFFRIDRPEGGEPEFAAWSPTLVDPADFHKPAAFGRLVVA